MSKFRLFSTDIAATVTPDSVTPAPSTLIVFDQDPLHSEYNPSGATQDRGSVIRTLGGNVIQDFGVVESDGLISFSDTDALSGTTVAALKTAYETVDGQWYFTDGYNCWKVQFSRNPIGFRSWRNLLFSYYGTHMFSYEIQLLVVSEAV